jgi:hypothetical protein
LACRLASRDELKAYANVLKELNRGVIEVALGDPAQANKYELLDFLLTESNAPVTWLAVLSRDDHQVLAERVEA